MRYSSEDNKLYMLDNHKLFMQRHMYNYIYVVLIILSDEHAMRFLRRQSFQFYFTRYKIVLEFVEHTTI